MSISLGHLRDWEIGWPVSLTTVGALDRTAKPLHPEDFYTATGQAR